MSLHDAAERNDANSILQLLARGERIDGKQKGYTPLFLAAGQGAAIAVRCLLENSASVDLMCQGTTPLTHASIHGYADIVELLLRANANPNLQDSKGFTALMHAASLGLMDVLKILVEWKADVHIQNKKGQVALDLSAESFQAQAAVLLLSSGTQIEETLVARNRKRQWLTWLTVDAPLIAASSSGNTIRLRELLGPEPRIVNRTDQHGNSLLMLACQAGEVETAGLLLEVGADINHQAKGGWTALTMAIRAQNAGMVVLLLDRGADPTLKTAGGWSPLSLACQAGNTELVLKLLGHARTSGATLDCSSAVDVAKRAGHLDLISLLRSMC